jgi:hypothetical protein
MASNTTVAPAATNAPPAYAPGDAQWANVSYHVAQQAADFATAIVVQPKEYEIQIDGGTVFAIVMALLFTAGFFGIMMLYQKNHKMMEARRRRHADMLAVSVSQQLRSSPITPGSPSSRARLAADSNDYTVFEESMETRPRGFASPGSPNSNPMAAFPARAEPRHHDARDYPASSVSLYRQGNYVPADPAKVRDILDDADL